MFYLDRGGLAVAAPTALSACKNAYKRHGRSSRLRETRANLIYISFYNGFEASIGQNPALALWMPPGTTWEFSGSLFGASWEPFGTS